MMDSLTAARLQMTVSLAFHMLYAAVGIGLPMLLVIVEGLYLRTGQPHYLALAKRWAKVMGLLFAVGAGFAVAIPVAVFLLALSGIHRRPEYRRTWFLGPVAAAGALLMPLTPAPVLGIGLWLAAIVTVKTLMTERPAAIAH